MLLYILYVIRDNFVYAPSQWETTLQCNVVGQWLGAYTKWFLCNEVSSMKGKCHFNEMFIIGCLVSRNFFIWITFGGASDEYFNKIKTLLFPCPSLEEIGSILGDNGTCTWKGGMHTDDNANYKDFIWSHHDRQQLRTITSRDWLRYWHKKYPDSKVHGANMGPIWGLQDPGGPHVGSMNLAILVSMTMVFSAT